MKNRILLVIESLAGDESLMRFDKVAEAVALLREVHGEVPKEVSTGPVPMVGEIAVEIENILKDFESKMVALEEKFPSLKDYHARQA